MENAVEPSQPNPETILQNLLEQFTEQTGEYWGEYVSWVRGEMVEEFTDIKETTVQMLMNWSGETGHPLADCVRDFMLGFWAEMLNLKEQGAFAADAPLTGVSYDSLERLEWLRQPEAEGALIESLLERSLLTELAQRANTVGVTDFRTPLERQAPDRNTQATLSAEEKNKDGV